MSEPVALVTGGSGGIGRACAETLKARGYDVVIAARDARRLQEVADAIGVRGIRADCTGEADVQRLLRTSGSPRLVVHAAGILAGTFVRDENLQTFEEVLSANLRSAFLVTREALGYMTPGSRIIYISSVAGQDPMKGLSAYSASKAGLKALALAVAAEVERDGIAVHLVTPAPVRTGMIDPATKLKMWLLEAADVAGAVAWLDGLPPHIVVPDLVLRSVSTGPFAPEPIGQKDRR